MNNRIRSIIQQMVTKDGITSDVKEIDYSLLQPISSVENSLFLTENVQFKPHSDYDINEYVINDELSDNSVRCEIFNKLNEDIRTYNNWVLERNKEFDDEVFSKATNFSGFIKTDNFDSKFYDSLNEFDPWSFLLGKSTKLEDAPNPIHSLYFVISDEELYKLKDDDPDFVPRFNKTIYDYIKLQKQSAEEDGRWDEKNIWYQPFRNFGDWFDKNPSDAEPYELGHHRTDVIDALWSVADDLRDRVPNDFPTYRDAYKWWCEHHTHKGKDVTWESLENEFKKAKGLKVD